MSLPQISLMEYATFLGELAVAGVLTTATFALFALLGNMAYHLLFGSSDE